MCQPLLLLPPRQTSQTDTSNSHSSNSGQSKSGGSCSSVTSPATSTYSGMESSSTSVHRSTNSTPHHHYYSPTETPASAPKSNYVLGGSVGGVGGGASIVSPYSSTPVTDVNKGSNSRRLPTNYPSHGVALPARNINQSPITVSHPHGHHNMGHTPDGKDTSGLSLNLNPPPTPINNNNSINSGSSGVMNGNSSTVTATSVNSSGSGSPAGNQFGNVPGASHPTYDSPYGKNGLSNTHLNPNSAKRKKLKAIKSGRKKNPCRNYESGGEDSSGVGGATGRRGRHAPQELLPICDALFNVISLAAYFCDIVFDVLSAYSFYNDDEWAWSVVATTFIALSVILSQILSFYWYHRKWTRARERQRRISLSGDRLELEIHELEGPEPPCSQSILLLTHLSLCGVLWRYFKLFIPVDLRFVKSEVRDLCLLRLVHAFCEGAPMLLIQTYLIWKRSGPDQVSDLNLVSTALSLFSVCWALASFSKNIRRQNVHKLVLTWLGVIFQFLWRLGTVSSRVIALSLYTTVYTYWLFLVIVLHWFSMLMWLISPKNIFHGEKMSTVRKVCYSALVALVYVFCYINVQESNSRQKVIIYYVTMFLENSLLFGVWFIAMRFDTEIWYREMATFLVFSSFIAGIAFMCLYYRYFHVKKLSYVYDTGTVTSSSSCRGDSRGSSLLNGGIHGSSVIMSNGSHHYYSSASSMGKVMRGVPSSLVGSSCGGRRAGGLELTSGSYGVIIPNGNHLNPMPRSQQQNASAVTTKSEKRGAALYNKINGHHIHHPNVPGVFNCRFHPAMKRKKKKPTSFVPPPAVPPANPSQISASQSPTPQNEQQRQQQPPPSSHGHSQLSTQSAVPFGNVSRMQDQSLGVDNLPTLPYGSVSPPILNGILSTPKIPLNPGKMVNPFWKRPLSITMGSENEGSVGSRVDIQQKLQEKKQQQLAELREIEEEIKQGKLMRPHLSEIPEPVTVRQPIPFEKKQPWFRADPPIQLSPRPPIIIPPTEPNELVLDPQYLMYSSNGGLVVGSGFYDQPDWNYYEPLYQNDLGERTRKSGNNLNTPNVNINPVLANNNNNSHLNGNPSSRESIYKSYRIPSDIDSQISLPRSYTLPREFKYRRKLRKAVKNEHFLPSTNSSDGDVDSGEEDPEIYSHLRPYPLPLPSMHHVHMPASGGQANSRRHVGAVRKPHRLHETKL